jgi:hypothetical protein
MTTYSIPYDNLFCIPWGSLSLSFFNLKVFFNLLFLKTISLISYIYNLLKITHKNF